MESPVKGGEGVPVGVMPLKGVLRARTHTGEVPIGEVTIGGFGKKEKIMKQDFVLNVRNSPTKGLSMGRGGGGGSWGGGKPKEMWKGRRKKKTAHRLGQKIS